ncbi:MAG TPA: asparagine synthase (glutamine-hydrolyzing), partial [bacterium]|nr:asparagine synthase (glutamine-hydrolyzing) [bacterium]
MCGICGLIDKRGGAVPAETLRRMMATIRHRGPDDSGAYARTRFGIGMQRLSVIDLVTGHQPIFNEDESVAVVFNGEIYNFAGLREELLRSGHRFRTNTDTEVIVHLYEEYGLCFPEHLRGMFAIAVLDCRNDQMVLVRDRLGIKPLYYADCADAFVFGSEIKAVLASGAVARDIDPRSIDDYFSFLYIPGPNTVYRHIRSLQPGRMLVYKDGGVTERPYWRLSRYYEMQRESPYARANDDELASCFAGLLSDAVREQLVSDVPIGAFLSGGIDSSTVVASMQRAVAMPVKTFSIGFGGSPYSELRYARAVAERYRTDHHEFDVRPRMVELLPKLAGYFDEPFADSSLVPTYLVSEAARRLVTVALSGDGGDESFAGYSWTRTNHRLERYRLLPSMFRRAVAGSLKLVPWRSTLMRKVIRAADAGADDYRDGFIRRVSCCDADTRRTLYSGDMRAALGDYCSFDRIRGYFDE